MRPSRQEGFARNDETAQADTVTERAADFLRSYRKLLSVEIIAIALLAALIGAFAGPFGTFDAMSLSERAVYWGLVSVVSILLGRTAFGLIALAGAEAGSVWEALGGAVLTAAFVTGGVWGVTQLFTHARPMTPDLPVLFVNVLLVTVGVVFLRQLVVRRGAKPAPPTVAEEEPRSDPEPEAAEGARPVCCDACRKTRGGRSCICRSAIIMWMCTRKRARRRFGCGLRMRLMRWMECRGCGCTGPIGSPERRLMGWCATKAAFSSACTQARGCRSAGARDRS